MSARGVDVERKLGGEEAAMMMGKREAAPAATEAEQKASAAAGRAAGREQGDAKAADAAGDGAGGDESSASMTGEAYTARHTGVVPQPGQEAKAEREEEAEASRALVEGVYDTADAYYSTLCSGKADNFAVGGKPEEKPIWVAKVQDKVVDVLKGMVQRNILSVPVLLPDGRWYGFLDMMDVVRYVVHHFGKNRWDEQRNFWQLVKEEKKFEQKTVEELMSFKPGGAAGGGLFVPVVSGYSAFAVMETMARERSIRRVPVVNNHKEAMLVNLVTQSQCVRWLARHVDLLGPKKDKPVALCTHFFKEVISVSEDDKALDAFYLMVERNIQGLAVLDKDGKLVGNISIRDLKIIGPDVEMFWRLQQTVKNFLVKVRHEYAARHPGGGRQRHAIYVLPKASVRDVIVTLHGHDIHRVYVCNNHKERRVTGVISLRDLLLETIGV